MRKALLICYYFPPLGLGGIGRPLNLFKKLPDHGWDCDILTVKSVAYRAYEPELLDGLDATRIFRSGSRDPQRLLYLLGVRQVTSGSISKTRKVSERFFPDSKAGWVNPAVRLGRVLCENRNYDCIISTSPPISSHLVGSKLSAEFGIPWVADFRDFWTTYRVEEVFQNQQLVARGQQLLEQIRKESAAITVVNSSISDYLTSGDLITNGYESDLAELWKKTPSDKWFTIGLLGHQLDTREVEPLLRLLSGLKERCPNEFGRLRLLQVGQADPQWFQQLFTDHDLDIRIECHGRQLRGRTIELLAESHAFFMAVSDKVGKGVLPSRTFELIASGRPIVANVPDGSEVARLLAGTGNALCYENNGTENAVGYLGDLLTSFRDGSYQYLPLSDYARQFSSDAIAGKFANLMDRLL
jgi:hypothetical protein